MRKQLRLACEAVEEVLAGEVDPDERSQLRGIAEQLRHAVDGASDEPEAVVLPERGALDTMQRRLTDVIEGADDETATRLRRARESILLAILTLEDQWQRQHEGPTGGG